MFIRRLLPIVALFTLCVASAQPKRVVLDRVVAVVGNSSILESEVHAYAQQLVEQRRSKGYTSDRDPRNEALEEMLTQKLLANQAVIDSVEVNLDGISARVDAQVKAMTEAAGGVVELERKEGVEIYTIRENMRVAIEEQMNASGMRNEILDGVTIIPGEVEQFFKTLDLDKIPAVGDQYVYAQITKYPSSKDEATRRVKERLLEMRERIAKGETNFKVLATMYSVDPGSAYKGGEMDPQPSSAFVPAFAEALELLKPGQVSEAVESEFGFHIIELIDRKGNMFHCRHILLKPTYNPDELEEPTKFLDSLVKEIRRDSLAFDVAAKKYSDDNSSKMNGGIVSNHDLLERYSAYDAKLTVTKFLKEDFGARGYKSIDDYTNLSKLKEGEVSDAFLTQDMMGNQLSKVVKLVKIIPSHKASMEEDYVQLEKLALSDKEDRVFDEWLNKHIASMYIYIAPEYRSDEFSNKNWIK
ncbi:MAG: peptidylprolyl isomerase [Rikenellaceae bacterium]